jgi:hypothetical protein
MSRNHCRMTPVSQAVSEEAVKILKDVIKSVLTNVNLIHFMSKIRINVNSLTIILQDLNTSE